MIKLVNERKPYFPQHVELYTTIICHSNPTKSIFNIGIMPKGSLVIKLEALIGGFDDENTLDLTFSVESVTQHLVAAENMRNISLHRVYPETLA